MTGPSGEDLHALCDDARRKAGSDPAQAIRALADVLDALVHRGDIFWEVMTRALQQAGPGSPPAMPPSDFMESITAPGLQAPGVIRLKLGGKNWVAAVSTPITPAELVEAYPTLMDLVTGGEDPETS